MVARLSLVICLLACACGGASGPVAKMPTPTSNRPDFDLHVIDVNVAALRSSGDHQTDAPTKVEARYFWTAEPAWGSIIKILPKPDQDPNKPIRWARSTSNAPIAGIYRVTRARRILMVPAGRSQTCYSTSLTLAQDTTTDADASREALTDSRIVAALAQGDVEDATKVEVSCDGFDQIQNVGREPSKR